MITNHLQTGYTSSRSRHVNLKHPHKDFEPSLNISNACTVSVCIYDLFYLHLLLAGMGLNSLSLHILWHHFLDKHAWASFSKFTIPGDNRFAHVSNWSEDSRNFLKLLLQFFDQLFTRHLGFASLLNALICKKVGLSLTTLTYLWVWSISDG